MGSYVHVKEVVMVTPSDPTPSRVLTLSVIDSQLFLRFTIEYLLVYKVQPASDRCLFSARLKSALAKALVTYYPLAGRVRVKPDGSKLEVLCRAQGALFFEAVSDHYTLADFEQAPRYVTEWRKLLSLHVADVLGGSPPLVVQLTWLKDGAVAIAIGLNHCLIDGIGSAEFLNSFSELVVGKRGSSAQMEFRPRPVWDRHLVDNFIKLPCRINSVTQLEFNRVPDLCNFVTRFHNEPLVPTAITFGKRSLNELKNIALTPISRLGEFSYTSFEVLSAHVWRSWARALKLPSNQTLKLLFSINVRKRVKPSLPAGFYGNAFVLGCAQTRAKDLVEKGLYYAAGLIKRAKEQVGDEYVRNVVASLSESRACPDSVGVLVLSQWSRLGLERVDFGMGKPIHVGPICCDRYCLLLPVYDQTEAVKVMVAVPTNAVDRYELLVRNPDT